MGSDKVTSSSIRMTEKRERRFEDLQEALDENTFAKALDQAAKFTTRMRGGTTAVPKGKLTQLLEAADERGSLTAAEIAEIVDTPEIPVEYESSWSVGADG